MMNFELPLIIEDEEYNVQSQDELSHWHNSFELIEVVEGKAETLISNFYLDLRSYFVKTTRSDASRSISSIIN